MFQLEYKRREMYKNQYWHCFSKMTLFILCRVPDAWVWLEIFIKEPSVQSSKKKTYFKGGSEVLKVIKYGKGEEVNS